MENEMAYLDRIEKQTEKAKSEELAVDSTCNMKGCYHIYTTQLNPCNYSLSLAIFSTTNGIQALTCDNEGTTM